MNTNVYIVFVPFPGRPFDSINHAGFQSGDPLDLIGDRNDSVRVRFEGREYAADRNLFFRRAKKPELSSNPQ
jgi:hypothetical protein